jgi:hypothetical protein
MLRQGFMESWVSGILRGLNERKHPPGGKYTVHVD